MLLRKLMSHLKRQDWFAVGIDFLIVVFGVFFGFQVTDWNQARQDRALERGYITRISHDIARSRDQIAASNDAMRIQADGATLVLSTLDTCQLPATRRDAFARALYNLGKFDTAPLSTKRPSTNSSQRGAQQSFVTSNSERLCPRSVAPSSFSIVLSRSFSTGPRRS